MDIFAQLKKFDETTGYFEAIAADETPDLSGERFDYSKSKPHFEEWSATIAKATDGKSLGNVRAMHGKVAAGKLTQINFDDTAKAIKVAGLVIDPAERMKMAQGVYTGLSIGGQYGKKWVDPQVATLTRYEAIPSEVSIVDYPCNQNAFFTVTKDGSGEEMRKFAKVAERKDVDPEEGKKKYGDVEFADEKNKKYPLDTAAHVEAAWKYIHMPKNADKYSAEDVKTIKAKIVAAWKKKINEKGPPAASKYAAAQILQKHAQSDAFAKFQASTGLRKDLCTVAWLANLLQQLGCLQQSTEDERESEGDDSKIPDELAEQLKALGDTLVSMTTEEVSELTGGQAATQELAMSASAVIEKRGAKHSQETKDHHAAIREHAVAIGKHLDALQAQPDEDAGEADKSAGSELAKAVAERDVLMKAISARDEALVKAAGVIETQKAEIIRLLKQPEPLKAALLSISKSADGVMQFAEAKAEEKPVLKPDGTPDEGLTKLRAALRKPVFVR